MKNVFIRSDTFCCDSEKSRAIRDILDKAREEIISVLGTEIFLDVMIQKEDPLVSADEMPDKGVTESYLTDSERLSKADVCFPPLCENGKELPVFGEVMREKETKFKMKETPKERKEIISFDKELADAVDSISEE